MTLDELYLIRRALDDNRDAYDIEIAKKIVEREIKLKTLNPVTGEYDVPNKS